MGIIISDRKFRWPNGTIPFVFDETAFPEGDSGRATIQSAIDHWNRNTMLTLRPRSNEPDYVRFVPANGTCSSSVGRQGGRQTIGCDLSGSFDTGSIIHEIGHAVGLFHEHTREDRDKFVTVHFDNIKDDKKFAFEKNNKKAHDIGPYDYGSVMHYSEKSTAFAIDTAKNTITAPKPVGQRKALSNVDIATVAEGYSLSRERFFATFRKANRSEIKVYKWKEKDLLAKYNELRPKGWRLRDLQPYVINDEVRYNAIWFKSKRKFDQIQVYGWKYQDFRAKYDELRPKGWRLSILRLYVIKNQVFYTAVWIQSSRDEIQVYAWKEKDIRAKYNELWSQGWRLKILQPYVVNDQVLYDSVWNRINRREIQVYGWKPEDFRKKSGELRRKGWHIHLLQPYLQGNELRYTAVWTPRPNRSERYIFDRGYARYKAYHDKLFSEGWRVHRLTVI